MYARCPPAWASAGSRCAALWGAWAEAQDVLAARGVAWETKPGRLSASRSAARARLAPQSERPACAATVAGRRGVRRSDGGRLRRRAPTRGPRTQQGRRRDTGAWRAPTGLIGYGVEAEGTHASRCAPCMDATRTGPAAVCALLRLSVQRLASPRAAPVLFRADGAPGLWQGVPLLGQA